jgi:Isoprenylcysteine carboxyl methyltransferase (ICMT) family
MSTIIRWIAILTLHFFTVSVTIRDGHRLIRHGIYSVIRHPAYIGWIIFYMGIGLAIGNWLSFTLILIATVIGFGYRNSREGVRADGSLLRRVLRLRGANETFNSWHVLSVGNPRQYTEVAPIGEFLRLLRLIASANVRLI